VFLDQVEIQDLQDLQIMVLLEMQDHQEMQDLPEHLPLHLVYHFSEVLVEMEELEILEGVEIQELQGTLDLEVMAVL
jgi:hypothetical protein